MAHLYQLRAKQPPIRKGTWALDVLAVAHGPGWAGPVYTTHQSNKRGRPIRGESIPTRAVAVEADPGGVHPKSRAVAVEGDPGGVHFNESGGRRGRSGGRTSGWRLRTSWRT